MLRFLAIAVFMISPTISLADIEQDERNLQRFIESSEFGADQFGGPVYLEKSTVAGWARVALFFGYVDDYAGCEEAVVALEKTLNLAEFRCIPALP